jgi:hypothetical protein
MAIEKCKIAASSAVIAGRQNDICNFPTFHIKNFNCCNIMRVFLVTFLSVLFCGGLWSEFVFLFIFARAVCARYLHIV